MKFIILFIVRWTDDTSLALDEIHGLGNTHLTKILQQDLTENSYSAKSIKFTQVENLLAISNNYDL